VTQPPASTFRAHPSWARPARRYLNTASFGLPPREAVDATLRWVREWQDGSVPLTDWLPATDRARELLGQFAGVPVDNIAIGSSVAQLVGLVAASVPDGSVVLGVDGEFASLLHPFRAQADRGVRVETVPRDRLAEAAGERGDLIAFSLVSSAGGIRADDEAALAAARARGAVTLVDAAQAIGWLSVDYTRYDIVVAPAFKWLCSPRGTAFMCVRPEHLDWLRPGLAGWWPSVAEVPYYGPLQLPATAKRLDATPVWSSWPGTAAALEVLTGIGVDGIAAHVLGLAQRLRGGLGLPDTGTAFVLVDDRGVTARLAEAGIVATLTPAGTRLTVHVYNDESDIDAALDVLRG
jgi:selenocysteine lyase/cysteine desulfurase